MPRVHRPIKASETASRQTEAPAPGESRGEIKPTRTDADTDARRAAAPKSAPPARGRRRIGDEPSSPKKPTAKEQRKALDAVAEAFSSFRPAAKVFSLVRAVPTIFPQLDYGTRIGGWPIERSTLVHGPSSEGKTLFVIGLMKSFLLLDHWVLFLDAERTTPRDWLGKLLGPLLLHKNFHAAKPETFEEARELVRRWLKTIIQLKDAGHIPRDAAALIVADSLGKFLPKDMVDELLKATKEGKKENKDVDLGGRRNQRQAALNKAWLDELIVLLDRAGASFVPIVRETKDPKASDFAKKFGTDFLPGGGAHIFYEAALAVRIESACHLYEGGEYDKDKGKENVVVAEKHRVTIYKTKVGGKDGTKTVVFFHSSNGAQAPFGYDLARDLLDVAIRLKVVDQKGSSYSFRGERFAQGNENAVIALQTRPQLLADVETETRGQFTADHDPETGELLT